MDLRKRFDSIYDEYWQEIYTFIKIHRNLSEADSKDCAQEVFTIFWKKMIDDKIDFDSGNVKGYLYAIADKTVQNYKRKNLKHTNEVYLYEVSEEFAIFPFDNVTSQIYYDELVSELCNNEELSNNDRKIFTYKYIHDKDTKELAVMFNTSEDNVRRRLSRARKRIMMLLEDKLGK